MQETRNKLEVFRVTPSERRELTLLAKARDVSKSELLRQLVRKAAEQEAAPGGKAA